MSKAKEEFYITVGDLINFLQTVDKNLPVGTTGHFGEFFPINKFDFCVLNVTEEQCMENKKSKSFKILNIHTPDIGPEPD